MLGSLRKAQKGKSGRHKTRVETQTKVEDGPQMDAVLRVLGYQPSFRYEKFQPSGLMAKDTSWSMKLPSAISARSKARPRWIDRTALALEIHAKNYLTETYAELFFAWKRRTKSPAQEMTFRAIRISLS